MSEIVKVAIGVGDQKHVINVDSAIVFGINEIDKGKYQNFVSFAGKNISHDDLAGLYAELTVNLFTRLFKDDLLTAGFFVHSISERLHELLHEEILAKASKEELAEALTSGHEAFADKIFGDK